MKKIISLSLIVLMIMGLMNFVQANDAPFKMSVSSPTNELKKDESFTVDVILSDIQAEKGIIALGATLKYDERLELVNMEAKGKWANSLKYNSANGKFVVDRGGYATSNETIFTMTFKVKEDSKENLEIALRSISASNGDKDLYIGNISTTVKIKGKEVIVTPPVDDPKPTETPNQPEQPKQDANTNQAGNDTNVGGNTAPQDSNNTTPSNPTTNAGNTSSTTNSGTNTNSNVSAGTNSNKKPIIALNKKPVTTNNVTEPETNSEDNTNTEPEEISEIIDENAIDENDALNEIPTNIVLSTNIGESNEDEDFNYPLLIGGTMTIIAAEMAVAIRIKRKSIKKKAVKVNENIAQSEYASTNVVENIEADVTNNSTITNSENDFSQDNSYGSEIKNRGNDVENNNNYYNRPQHNNGIRNNYGNGYSNSYSNYSRLLQNEDKIRLNTYNRGTMYNHKHFDDIK